jgi:hypothetical protein
MGEASSGGIELPQAPLGLWHTKLKIEHNSVNTKTENFKIFITQPLFMQLRPGITAPELRN